MSDDDLRDRLRRTDPAASLTPLPPDRVSRLLEESMSAVVAAPPRRLRLPVLAAAAAAVLLLAGAGWLIFRPRPAEAPSTSAIASSPAATVRLTAPDGGHAAKCREPQPSQLASSADFAFAGTVTGIDATNVVTLAVTRVYRGTRAALVQVDQQPGTSETLMGSGKFEPGKNYLVAANQGTVMICGYSGEADAEGLLSLYEKAF
ncbi:hypothetical protein [Actinoplanes sp. NPDC026619]|uniref:hypothetical protein n=1 Tax=Actinoplanes sp. NPDC026619 TaxID=3155798 RepID=UPI0033FC9336